MTSTIGRRYILVSPVKDEASHIELTLQSVTNQHLKPALWVIVDDGSTDETARIVQQYASAHPFITLLSTPAGMARNTGRAEALAFNRGCESVRELQFDFIVKLDGDLSFSPDYFEKLLDRFVSDDSLGIASGVYLETDKSGAWKTVGMPSYHAFGACKVVRRTCFDAIGGFASRPGWDTADEICAWSRGWKTRHFPDLEVRHHKPEGSAMGFLRTSRMHGEIHYVTGGDPFFFLFKVLHRARLRPFLLGALALMFGYAEAVVRRKPLLVTPQEGAAYRQLLRERLWRFARSPLSSTEYRI